MTMYGGGGGSKFMNLGVRGGDVTNIQSIGFKTHRIMGTEIQPKELFDLCVRTLTGRTVSKFKGL